ncbi:two-component system, chemotaxis family, response regulator CheB [Nitrosospira multiformis]|uniref:Protein-glutamate methylesterase/protein-glutamine glutaminase n=1 Tax=Nitrosospira multiformis TaxID=1231 RepID=A0A1H8DMT8_9PROT|nr:chemotaxis-specific protein-glutamate methyltransferase CheB [Nitrosospira multiformis]SEN08553.1 two-component system, chemotaxis family, response regulator CheB [Nitrosospira multiformis]
MINVLVVEDSPVVREFLIYILNSDPDITVIATAGDGEEAIDALRNHRPDVITMDIHMPKLNGVAATQLIMETQPTPIVIVSGSTDPAEVGITFDAIDAGALAVLPRPAGIGHPDHEATARKMIEVVKLMSEVKVVRRWARMRGASPASLSVRAPLLNRVAQTRIVVVGASTGGPPALEAILSSLPKHFPVPILIVQHMTAGFMEGFVQWLKNSSNLPVHIARQGELPLPGHVYMAPDEYQMKVENRGEIVLTNDEPEYGSRPSISYLFRSVARVYGHDAVAGLLTGMGRDGADELRLLKEKGAITFAQDKESSVVHGMAGEAIRLGAATMVLPLEKIAAALTNMVAERGETKLGA